MAKKVKSKKHKGLDIPSDWKVREEGVEKEKKKRTFDISNNMLWVIFILVFVAFVAFAFVGRAPVKKDMETTYVNGIQITAPGEPVIALKSLALLHIEGKTISEDGEDATNALHEIATIIGQSGIVTRGGDHMLLTGITDRTGIFIDEKRTTIEGTDKAEFWKAVWTFSSIMAGIEIESDVDLYSVQDLFAGRKDVYLVQDMDESCTNYGRIISAEGDILSPLGFKSAQYGFDVFQYQETGGQCQVFGNATFEDVACPVPDEDTFVIKMMKGTPSMISISENEIVYQYSRCDTVHKNSVILRDLLYPNIVSAMTDVRLPVEL